MQENTDQKDSEYGHFSRSVFCEKCPATLLKKKLWRSCFPANFVKFLRTQFLQNTSGELFWLLLSQVSSWFVGNEAGGGESLNRCLKNTKHTKCSEGRTFLTHWYALFVFRKIWFALFSLNTRFEIRPFALLPTSYLCIWFWVY